MCTPPHPPPTPFLGVEPPTKFSKKVGLTRSQFLKRVTWKEVGDFFKVGGGGGGEVVVFT